MLGRAPKHQLFSRVRKSPAIQQGPANTSTTAARAAVCRINPSTGSLHPCPCDRGPCGVSMVSPWVQMGGGMVTHEVHTGTARGLRAPWGPRGHPRSPHEVRPHGAHGDPMGTPHAYPLCHRGGWPNPTADDSNATRALKKCRTIPRATRSESAERFRETPMSGPHMPPLKPQAAHASRDTAPRVRRLRTGYKFIPWVPMGTRRVPIGTPWGLMDPTDTHGGPSLPLALLHTWRGTRHP